MAHILSSVAGTDADNIPVRRALISVSDKSGLLDLAKLLVETYNVELLSTGGTAKAIRDAGMKVIDVSDYTGSPEILDGRVKTLNPKIHGGLLAVRGNSKHEREMRENGIGNIDLVIMNLYPFEATVASGADFGMCIENIDIGGPSMLRSSAKNHKYVTIVSSTTQYPMLIDSLAANAGGTTLAVRKQLACEAFTTSAKYDAAISAYFMQQVGGLGTVSASSETHTQTPSTAAASATTQTPTLPTTSTSTSTVPVSTSSTSTSTTTSSTAISTVQGSEPALVTRVYSAQNALKYGCNPHQKPAGIYSIVSDSAVAASGGSLSGSLPFSVVNGTPGYINLLDACNAWQLVRELKAALGAPAAASFKHCSPAGAAVGSVPLSPAEAAAYEISAAQLESLTPTALAYIRARNADPMCSFGDFVAISHTVDLATAKVLKTEVCDGIIAPGFDPEALEILKNKKKGAFIVLQADEAFSAPAVEYRDMFGVTFCQKRNDTVFTPKDHLTKVVCGGAADGSDLSADAQRDLVLASIAVKYTQSNSVGYAINGQMIGVGAGQQSRVDCVKLAARKVSVWFLRQHPKVQALPFKPTVKRQDRVNARVRYIEGDFTSAEKPIWLNNFTSEPNPLTEEEKSTFLGSLSGVTISSDAFFPFRDSIDHASKVGVAYVAQPGGSIADDEVIGACKEYGMTMAFTGLRLFHH